jgi:hypothetical protein
MPRLVGSVTRFGDAAMTVTRSKGAATTFLDFAPKLDADPRVMRARLLLIAFAHKKHRPHAELTFLLMSYHDFLLRLPTALERVLRDARPNRDVSKVRVETYERQSVEAQALPLRFEPWTDEYRLAASALVASKLLEVIIDERDTRKWRVAVTSAGQVAAETLAASPAFEATWRRAEIIVKAIDVKLNKLKQFIGRSVPETITLEARKVI